MILRRRGVPALSKVCCSFIIGLKVGCGAAVNWIQIIVMLSGAKHLWLRLSRVLDQMIRDSSLRSE